MSSTYESFPPVPYSHTLQDVLPINLSTEQKLSLLMSAADTSFTQADYTQAVILYTRALALGTDSNAILLYNRALSLFNLKKLQKALADVNGALSYDPHATRSYILRANIHMALGNQQQAALDYIKASEFSENETTVKPVIATNTRMVADEGHTCTLVNTDQKYSFNITSVNKFCVII